MLKLLKQRTRVQGGTTLDDSDIAGLLCFRTLAPRVSARVSTSFPSCFLTKPCMKSSYLWEWPLALMYNLLFFNSLIFRSMCVFLKRSLLCAQWLLIEAPSTCSPPFLPSSFIISRKIFIPWCLSWSFPLYHLECSFTFPPPLQLSPRPSSTFSTDDSLISLVAYQ